MEKIVLKNGLKVLFKPLNDAKKACIMINVGVGSKDEEDKISGISHFTEHLAFKSNKHRSAKQITKDLEYNGTIVNAYTSYENTTYYGKCLKSKCNDTIQILFEALTSIDYIEKEVELERQVVLTELQNYIEMPDRHILDLFFSDLFDKSSYKNNIGGTNKTVSNMSMKILKDFKEKFYIPNNMIISVAGNFDKKQIIKKIENTFGQLKQKPLKKSKIIQPINKRRRKNHKKTEINQSFLAMGYIVPTTSKKESIILEYISSLMGDGLSSRMFDKLREDNGIGYGVGCYYHNIGKSACLIMDVNGFDNTQEKKAIKIIKEIMEDLKNNDVSDDEFQGVKNFYTSQYIDFIKKVETHAQEIINQELYNNYYEYDKKDKVLKTITKKDIKRVAKKCFNEEITISLLKQ